MTARDLINKLVDIANNYKTLYVYACFGAPMTQSNKNRYMGAGDLYAYNRNADRAAKIRNLSNDTFGFDCVNLIKGVLWGWNGNLNHIYGGAVYGSNGCPDTNANGMFWDYCYNQSNNFNNIVPGEFVWMEGHIGVYIGNGLAVECTPIWKDGVQITAVGNIGSKAGYPTRTWTSHAKSKLIDYSDVSVPEVKPTAELKYKEGQNVIVNGQLYGTSSGENPGAVVNNVETVITRTAPGSQYPYNTTGDLGWVAESSITLIKKYDESSSKEETGEASVELKIGDYVKIIGNGNGSSEGDSNTAVPGYEGTITNIYEGRPFPYEVSDHEGVLGYYPATSLQK